MEDSAIAMKKNKKVVKKTEPKNRSYVRDMIKRDMESCAEKDIQDAKLGKAKPKRDIYKDDPCYHCTFAMENRDENIGPFDRRFVCFGITRILNLLMSAASIVKKVGNYVPSPETSLSPSYISPERRNQQLLKAQDRLLYVSHLIALLVRDGKLDCCEMKEMGKLPCYYGGSLEEFISK